MMKHSITFPKYENTPAPAADLGALVPSDAIVRDGETVGFMDVSRDMIYLCLYTGGHYVLKDGRRGHPKSEAFARIKWGTKKRQKAQRLARLLLGQYLPMELLVILKKYDVSPGPLADAIEAGNVEDFLYQREAELEARRVQKLVKAAGGLKGKEVILVVANGLVPLILEGRLTDIASEGIEINEQGFHDWREIKKLAEVVA